MYKVEDGEIVRSNGFRINDADRVRLCVCANMFATHNDPVAVMKSLRDLVTVMVGVSSMVNVSMALPVLQFAFNTLNLGDES